MNSASDPLSVAARPIFGRLRATLTFVSVVLLASYFVLVLLQVFFRYVLNESLFWAEEFVRGLMLWGVMLSSALVAAGRAHIRIEVLELMLPPAGRRIVMMLVDILTLAFCLTLVWAGIELVDRTWFQRSPLLDVPKYSVYLAVPIGAAIEAIFMIMTWQNHAPSGEPTDRTL
jgi:TRAP-type C4-dicarboxylate transport system permease small subunit